MAVNPLFSGPGQSSRNHQYSGKLPSASHSHNNNKFTTSLVTQEGRSIMDPAIPRKKPRLNSDGNTETEISEDPFDDFGESFTADDLDAIDMIASQALSQIAPNSTNAFTKAPSSSSSQFSPKAVKHTNNNIKLQQGFPASDNAKKERSFSSYLFPSRDHPVQTNSNIPFHQLGNRGMKMVQGVTSGNNFLKKRTSAGGGDGNVRNQLTPPKGTTMNSPALPADAQDKFSQAHKLQQELERFKSETEILNQRLNAMKSEKYKKEGEIQLLRQNLSKAQTDISKLQIERIKKDEQKQREQASKEKELQREVEALKTQLEFKEREIIEIQTSFRNLQQRTGQEGQQGKAFQFNCPSPRKSPRLIQVTSPRKAFPTKTSFMTAGTKQPDGQGSPLATNHHRSPVVTKGSPLKNQTRPGKAKSSGTNVSAGRSSSNSLIKKWNPPKLGKAMQLKTRISKGYISPSLMVGLLMKKGGESKMERSGDSSNLFAMFNLPSELSSKDSTSSDGSEPGNIELMETDQQEDTRGSTSRRAACEAISCLLNSPNQDTHSLSVPLPRHPMALDTPSLAEYHLAKIIPVIQEQLNCYLQELESFVEMTRNRARSKSPSHHEVEQTCLEERVVECRTKALVPGLETLSKLCCHSRSICKMVTAGCDQIQEAMGTSAEELDASAPITFTHTSSRGRSSSDQSCQAEWMKEPCRVVQLLHTVLKFQPVKGHPCQTIRETGWKVICVLCRNTPDSKLQWCSPFLVQDSLPLALSTISTMDTWMSAITSTAAVAAIRSVCTQTDTCPLTLIYQLGTSLKVTEDNSDKVRVTLLRLEIINLLLGAVSSQVNGASSLVETNCQCSYEGVATAVFIMMKELKLAETSKSSQRWHLLKQGLLFLHMIIMQTRALAEQKLETEMEILLVIVRLHRLFKKASEMNKSQACMLQDIWECVAGEDDVWEDDEDDDEDEEMQEDD